MSVAVIDSMAEFPDTWIESHTVIESDNVTDSEDDPIAHGWYVANIIDSLTDENIEFFIYRVFSDEAKIKERHLLSAIDRAVKNDVDVINLSIGSDHVSSEIKPCTPYSQECAVSDVVEKAAMDGSTIVAGAGNKPDVSNVACPSLSSYAVSVGGFVPKCDSTDMAPGACWINADGGQEVTAICSMNGCGPGYMCSNEREDVLWDLSPDETGSNPDILAPVHFPFDPAIPNHSDYGMISGTSFAAPLITAQTINYLQVYKCEDIEVSPTEIRNAYREAGRPIENTDTPVLDGIGSFNSLGDPYGIEHQRETSEITELDY